MKKNYDVVIIGAGFAGMACAESTARENLATLVMERKPEAGSQLHTTGIVIKEMAETWNIPKSLTRPIGGVRLYGPALDYVDLHAPDYYFLATDTAGLLCWQALQAERAGAKILYEHPYRYSHRISKYHEFTNEQLRCRYLVGCDGARSRVAKQYYLGLNRKFLIGIEADFPECPDVDQDRLHVFIDSDLARGYIGWVVPGVRCTQIGIATRFPHPPKLQEFLRKVSRIIPISGKQPFSHRAGVIPCGGPVYPFYRDKVMLLGDAAGMVSPLTAGGIHSAVQTGLLAGTAIADHLLYDGPDPGLFVKQKIPRYAFKKLLRICTDHVHVPNTVYDQLLNTPLFCALAQNLFFHKRGLFTMEAWRDIIRIFSR